MQLSLRIFPWSCVLLALSVASAGAQKETFTPQHIAKLRYVTSVAISPDGKSIAYTMLVPRDLSKEKDGGAWSELHVVDLEGKSAPYITGEVSVANVHWTPDGKSISFLAKRDKDAHRSIYTISLTGGEARKVLEFKTDIGSHSWASDGKRVAFLATEPTPEKEKKLQEKGFTQQIYEEDNKYTRVWIGSIAEDADEPQKLDLVGNASDLHWAPKGDLIAVAVAKTPLIDDSLMYRRIHTIDAKTGKVVAKLANPGKIGELAWSPDGKTIALISAEDIHDPREGQLWVAEAQGGKWKNVLPDYKAHVASIAWRDTKSIVYQSGDGVGSTIGEVGRDGTGNKILVPNGTPIFGSLSISADGKTLAMTGHTATSSYNVYVLDSKTKEPRRLTMVNPWLKNMKFAKQEVVEFKARDGLDLQGILIRPLDEKKGTKYPLILSVHGGPEAHESNGWLTTYSRLGQVAAANGFAVFYPNYRGSTGRGVEFSKMGQEDAAGKEFDDLVDAVDHLVETGLVDKDRVGITGGSYGGYATAWGSTRYSKRFAAGVMFVGISNNVSKVGTTDIPDEMFLVHHRKHLWDDWDYFLKRSPIYYIEQARTPLLILHGKNDPRVHPSQSMELYRHLKVRGETPVRLVFYPGEGHGNRRAASRLDYNIRALRWMSWFLKEGKKKAPPRDLDYGLEKDKDQK